MNDTEGLIVKATGGFYYVDAAGVLYECRARGVFRKQGVSPLVGDRVTVEPAGESKGVVAKIMPRKNALVRPPLANVDTFAVVASVADPEKSQTGFDEPLLHTLVIDKLMAIACHKNISPILVVTKCDLGGPDALAGIYRTAGMPVFTVSKADGSGLDTLRQRLSAGGITAFSGNSGVGKSSLLNRLDGRLSIATGETSRKLGRGRHTTRHVELYAFGDGYIADTPGFSAVELERYEVIRKEELAGCFSEFAQYSKACKFTGCSHTVEKGCAVLEAVRAGLVHPSRHASYCVMYEDAKKIKEWELKDHA